MTIEQIKRILSGLNYQTNARIQTPEIRALILSENQGIDYRKEFITFDTTNNLVRIKKYTHNVVSGKLTNSITVTGNELRSNNTIYLRHNINPFRAPRIGDKIIIIKSGVSYKDSGLIINNVKSNFITLTGPLTSKLFDSSTDQIAYADAYGFMNSVQDPITPAIFFKYTEISEHNDDVILDGNDLIGIEMFNGMLGSV